MGMRPGRCWFTECHDAGTLVDFDGSHPRSLCPKHANGVRLALDQPGTYRVRWGRSKAEQIAALEQKLPEAEAWVVEARALLDVYGPPRDPDTGLAQDPDDLWEDDDDPEYLRLRWQAWDAEVIVAGIGEQINELARRTWDHPIVRVEVVTR